MTRQAFIVGDLFCCEGIGARGYIRAGLTPIGADNALTEAGTPRFAKRYPGKYLNLDWELALELLDPVVDAWHTSPPCQGYTIATAGNPEARGKYPRLIPQVREALRQTGKPYVIENVRDARVDMIDPITLCGTMFDLQAVDDDGTPLEMHRHRLFESNFTIPSPGPCRHGAHSAQVAGSYGGARKDKVEARTIRRGGYVPAKHVQEKLLGVPAGEHTLHGLYQSIPPAYTEWIGRALMDELRG